MKDRDFQQLVDREFAPLEWTEEQRMSTLRLMRQPERKIMKKKLVAFVAIALMIVLTAVTSFSAGRNIVTIRDFLTGMDDQNVRDARIIVPVEEDKVASAGRTRHTSELVDVEVTQLYLSDEKLYLTAVVTPKHKDTLVYHEQSLPLTLGGQEMRYYDLYQQEDLTLLRIDYIDIDWEDVAFADTRPGEVDLIYSKAVHDEETMGLTLMCVYSWPSHLHTLEAGHFLQGSFVLTNARTHDLEWNVLFADVPQMERAHTEE